MRHRVAVDARERAKRAELAGALLDARPVSALRSLAGRETFTWTAPSGELVVVKRTSATRRAGFGRRCEAQVEHDALVELARIGVPVPRALAWAARASVSAVAMEHVTHERTLRERIAVADARERRALGDELAAIVARLHAAGWCHRDLYLQHFVLAERGLVLLDVGRALRVVSDWRAAFGASALERWFVKDVAALLHSTPRAVPERARLRFVARYLDLRRIDARAERRAFVARVSAKERRMASHRPRAGEDRPWTDR